MVTQFVPPEEMKGGNQHIPFLDGFRALAVILILFVHGDPEVFRFGGIGVPMFFVLSGFLITRILRNNVNSKNYFRTFYARRILRIFPIYYLVLFFCLAWGLLMKVDVSQFFYYFFYFQSFTISGAEVPVFSNGLLSHTWSLSVEEIFYFIWPAAVYLLKKRALIISCVVLILLSLFYKCICLYQGNDALATMSLFANIDYLMVGALLCLSVEHAGNNFSNLQKKVMLTLGFSNLLFISLLFFIENSIALLADKIALSISISWFSFYLILYLISASPSKFAEAFFGNKVSVYVGKISYGIYLYHFPVYMFIASILYHYKFYLNSVLEIAVKIVVTFAIASVSWFLIERPLLNLKSRFDYL